MNEIEIYGNQTKHRQSVAIADCVQGGSGLVRRRSNMEIKWSEWILTSKENGHETAY